MTLKSKMLLMTAIVSILAVAFVFVGAISAMAFSNPNSDFGVFTSIYLGAVFLLIPIAIIALIVGWVLYLKEKKQLALKIMFAPIIVGIVALIAYGYIEFICGNGFHC